MIMTKMLKTLIMVAPLTTLRAPFAVANTLQYVGVDWSSILVEERAGVVYKDTRSIGKPLETILVEAGINMVWQRVWTVDGEYGTKYNLQLARRAKDAGLNGWPQDIDGLERQLWAYTTEVCNTFAAAGLYPETITIGNEIPSGFLWPTGHIDNPKNLSRLLHTAARAVRSSSLGTGTKIVTHLAHGWDQDLVLVPGNLTISNWGAIAVSFYPFWGEGASMANLSATLNSLASKYNKEVQVVKANWPTSCPNPEYPFPKDQLDIPFSTTGQVEYLRRLVSTLKAIPATTGLNYWEPAWIRNAVLGSSCESNVLFDPNGKAYDSLSVFASLY
ncbi:hypothetical protein LCI18_014098 [Fusarium solani-melongenae]|uniref:Uncharacterized protein n=1 Tax=Fusarium solani subsp. cucurbitae TaxID=2747967 RepID=A0ACD3ZP96_FUSSC|nr:hypothetical protein LCI18_014098 [Fusarium solani-melongenae]